MLLSIPNNCPLKKKPRDTTRGCVIRRVKQSSQILHAMLSGEIHVRNLRYFGEVFKSIILRSTFFVIRKLDA